MTISCANGLPCHFQGPDLKAQHCVTELREKKNPREFAVALGFCAACPYNRDCFTNPAQPAMTHQLRFFAFLCALPFGLLAWIVQPLHAAEMHGRHLPDSLQRFDSNFSLAGCGLREFFFIDIYLLSLYLPDEAAGPATVHNSNSPRVFVLDVLYKGDMPDDLPNLWREPLSQQISAELLEILQEQYDRVDTGDRVELAWYPGEGEQLRINGELVVREPGKELMPALTEMWLGEDPVSGNLKRLLLQGDCS